MSWHTWCFGRQKSARTPCSGSRKKQMVEMDGAWHNPSYQSPTAQSWGSNISWLVVVMCNSYPGCPTTTILGIRVNKSEDPHPSTSLWNHLVLIFSPFIQRFWCLAYPLGHGCHLFADYEKNTTLCRNWGCALHPEHQGQRQWAVEGHSDPGLHLSLASYWL